MTKKKTDAAPAQPWAKDAAGIGADPVATDKAAEALTDSDTGNRIDAEAKDQVTPAGPNPGLVDAAAEAGTDDQSPNRIDAEAKDQVTPSGEDIASTLHAQIETLSDEEKVEFGNHMQEAASEKLKAMIRGREAQQTAALMVNGNTHYGNKARRKFFGQATEETQGE